MCEIVLNPLGVAGMRHFRLGANQWQAKCAHFPGLRLALRRPVSQAGKILFQWALELSSTAPSPTLSGALPRCKTILPACATKAGLGEVRSSAPNNYRTLGRPKNDAAASFFTLSAPRHCNRAGRAHQAFASAGCSPSIHARWALTTLWLPHPGMLRMNH